MWGQATRNAEWYFDDEEMKFYFEIECRG